jgi:hypothetical protein
MANEASLTIEEVCASLKNRGGFTGNNYKQVCPDHCIRSEWRFWQGTAIASLPAVFVLIAL